MRRRRSKPRRSIVAIALLCAVGRAGRAQTGAAVALQGAPEFLLPTGARGIGSAQAIVALGVGAEAIWWNPALIARGPREMSLNLGEQANGLVATDASGSIVWPVPRVGAFALTVRYLDFGEESSADRTGQLSGTFVNTGFIFAGSFAAPFGDRLAAGLTVKFLLLGSHCTGQCDLPAFPPRTAAMDFGMQYFVTADSVIAVGVSGLNVGFPLQVNDAPQADNLPSRADVGVSIAPHLSQFSKDAHARGEVDMITSFAGGTPGFRFGGELAWQERYMARAGYQLNGPTGSGPTVGLGFATGKLQVDFAQVLTDAGVGAGKPTFLSLRYVF
jgi:hypothetical protein